MNNAGLKFGDAIKLSDRKRPVIVERVEDSCFFSNGIEYSTMRGGDELVRMSGSVPQIVKFRVVSL